MILGQRIPHRVEQYKWKDERPDSSKRYADLNEFEWICRQVQDEPNDDHANSQYNSEDGLRRSCWLGTGLAMMHDRTNLGSEYSANDERQFWAANRNGPYDQVR